MPIVLWDFASLENVVSSDASSAQSAAITEAAVRVTSTVACWLAVGTNPTASVGGVGCFYLAAGTVFDMAFTSGDKIAVRNHTSAGAGVLSILPATTAS